MRTATIIVVALVVAGCAEDRPAWYVSDPGHYPYYRPVMVEETPQQSDGWLKGPRYLSGTSASIYDGTHYREGGVRMGNTINYPDGRVEFVRE